MKKLFLLIVMCLVGMMVPQGVLAADTDSRYVTYEVSDGGKTITITSTKAGALSGLKFQGGNNNALKNALAATNVEGGKIVFVGDFCENDLLFLKGQYDKHQKTDYCKQEIVDMSDAYFVDDGASSPNTYLYHSLSDRPTQSNDGTHCIVGATKYISVPGSFSWSSIGAGDLAPGYSWDDSNTRNVLASDISTIPATANDMYLRLPQTLDYYSWDESSNSYVKIGTPSPEQIAQAAEAPNPCTSANLNSDFSYLHYNGYSIVKVRPAADCEYEYFEKETSLKWTDDLSTYNEQDYNNGDNVDLTHWYSSIDVAEEPEHQGQVVYAGGTEYAYTGTQNNGQWVDPSEVTSETVYDYSQMSFKYWGSYVKTALTSRHMDASDTFPEDLTDGCSALSNLTLGSGNVTTLGGNPPLTTVTIGRDVTSLGGQQLFSKDIIKANLQTVSFELGGSKPLVIGEDCFMGCRNVTNDITIPARTTEIKTQAFKDFGPNPASFSSEDFVISFEDSENHPSQLSTFVSKAFQGCGITSLVVPSGITEIQREAFANCYNLKTITFGETTKLDDNGKQVPLVIRTAAFTGGEEQYYKLKDVNVDVNPDTRKLICEYDAFAFVALVGQTDVENEQMATLHFKEDYWDYYAGDWKKGLTFDQSTLDCIKDGCDPSSGIAVEDMEYKGHTVEQLATLLSTGYINGMSPANGWHQFARTDTGIDIIIPKGKFYRTYSTPIPLIKPTWMKIFRVNNFSDGFKDGDDINDQEKATNAKKEAFTYELNFSVTVESEGGERTYYCIPANTGLIRVDERDNTSIFYMLDWDHTPAANLYKTEWEYPYSVKPGDESDDESESGSESGSEGEEGESVAERVNYLVPTLGGEITIGPVERVGNTIKYRIFGLKKVTESGVVPQFSRSKRDVIMGDHRAFLKLPAKVFHWTDEKSGSSQDATGAAVVDETNTYAKVSLIFDDFFEEVNSGITTEIKDAIDAEMYKNDSFYTIQGIKVAKPTTKGVYIRNGKKIYIK